MKVKQPGKTLQKIIHALKEHQEELREIHKVKNLKVFGSYAKNEQTENSDLDLMVSFGKTLTLLEFIELKKYLESITGIKVDLVTEDGISPHIKPYIEATEIL
ncbi:MAG: nucleotidyltransferase family protein [Desulfurobacteriaceae bacterium]